MRKVISIPNVDHYLLSGCGRCELYNTAKCKVKKWQKELLLLREIAKPFEVVEEIKWSQPCYTYKNKNVFLITAFKNYACIAFFKGELLHESKKLLVSAGENSQSAKQFRFTSVKEIIKNEKAISKFISEAILLEKEGKKVQLKPNNAHEIPVELVARLKKDNSYKKAFDKLTPGRKRSYYIFIAQAKQAKTREDRVEKCYDKIKLGKGWNEY